MTSIRLPKEYEKKMEQIVRQEKTSKSIIIKDAFAQFFKNYEKAVSPYGLGKDLFGNFGSGQGNLSKDYKRLLRDRIHAKRSR